MGLMNIYKRRAKKSPSFVKCTQLTQVPKRGASKIGGGVKHGLLCTETFKETIPRKQLLAGVLNVWRRHYGEVLYGSIKHIIELYNDVGTDA